MTYDLRTGLGAIGAQERAAAVVALDEALPVGPLRARARRRRTVRLAATATTTLAVVGGIAVGAVAFAGQDGGGTPPAGPSPTASTAWAPDSWPSAVTLAGEIPACGDAVPRLSTPSGTPELAVETIDQGGPLISGGTAQTSVTLRGPQGFDLQARAPRLLLVQDGLVVATQDPRDFDESTSYSTQERSLTFPRELLTLVRCETLGRGAVPLKPGTYDLLVVVEALRPDPAAAGSIDTLPVVGGPTTITLEAP